MEKVTEGHRDANGNLVDIKSGKRTKPIKAMQLTMHPDAVIKNIQEVIKISKDNKEVKELFENTLEILKWARRYMNIDPMEND